MKAGDMLVLTGDREYVIGWDTPDQGDTASANQYSLYLNQKDILIALEGPNRKGRVKVLMDDGRIFWVHAKWVRIVS